MSKIFSKDNLGFTLVELLVVISIVSILAIAGVVVYSNIQKGARDSRRKADISAMAKAYEVKYQTISNYQAITDADFSLGNKPKDPTGIDYYNNLAADNSAYRVCAALENNPQRTCSSPSQNCFCASSAQGSYQASSGGNGIPPDSPSSCDPNGTLSYGLVGYWKMDSNANDYSGTVPPNNGTGNGGFAYSLDVPSSQFIRSGQFNGTTSYVAINPIPSDVSARTIVAWVKNVPSTGRYELVNAQGIFFNISSNKGCFYIYGANSVYLCSANSLILNQWNFIAATYGSGVEKIYLNNNSPDSLNVGNPSVGTYGDRIGVCSYCGNTSYLSGLMDDVRIYNRALAASEIAALYNNGNGCIP